MAAELRPRPSVADGSTNNFWAYLVVGSFNVDASDLEMLECTRNPLHISFANLDGIRMETHLNNGLHLVQVLSQLFNSS